MIGKVTVWKMTEEERLAYIKKHPIRPPVDAEKQSRGSSYADIHRPGPRKKREE